MDQIPTPAQMTTMIDYWQCDDYTLTRMVLFPSDFAGKATSEICFQNKQNRRSCAGQNLSKLEMIGLK